MGRLLFGCFPEGDGEGVGEVYTGLKMLRECASSSNFYSHPARETETDIALALSALEIQIMSYADGRVRDAHESYRRSGQSVIDSMPAVFSSLEQAREALEVVVGRSMHWLRSTMHLHTFPIPRDRDGMQVEGKEKDQDRDRGLFYDVDPTFSERLTTLSEYNSWNAAFLPLLNHARSRSSPHSTFIQASTLRLLWLAGYMSISSNNSLPALVNNPKHTLLLQELVEIARKLLKEEGNDGEGWDVRCLVPLIAVGWIYRCRVLRQIAVRLLMRGRGRAHSEMGWDGIVVGRIMSWLGSVEEDAVREGELSTSASETSSLGGGSPRLGEPRLSANFGEVYARRGREEEDEYVPEWAAARCIRMQFDASQRETGVSCLQPVRGGGERRREVVIPW